MSVELLRRLRVRAVGLSLVLTIPVIAVGAPPAAQADTVPAAGTPATVSADGLPTWQVNGVVWSQAVAKNVVFAGGKFTAARPPGVAVGGAGSVTANNFFAYDITTGNRVAAHSHSMNGQVLAVSASPDGSRVYVGGDFTTVDGVARNHLVAFDTTTGAVVTNFRASVSSRVRAISATDTTVYAGGDFFSANGSTRRRLAAFNASAATTAAAILPWAPTADDNKVSAMVVSPDKSRVIVGGSFTTLNGAAANGMGSVTATGNGKLNLPWLANQRLRDGGTGSAIMSLRTDGQRIYGSGYAFQTGQFEGAFAADPTTGTIIWANDCHGDTYDVVPLGQVVYTVSHAHDCTQIGGFFQSNPWSINMRHALAFTTYQTGMNKGVDNYGWDYRGVPSSSLLHWYPALAIGSSTGQSQAAWSATGTSKYLALAGEFPKVNGIAQQGLVRFATTDIAPNKRGPVRAPNAPTPTATSPSSGTVRVDWQAPYDMDNETLTYNVFRSGTAAAVYSTTAKSSFWKYPGMGFVDSGGTPGSSYTYTIRITDPKANVLTLARTNSVTVRAAAARQLKQGVADQPPPEAATAADATPTLVASDDFGRTVSSGWGSADTGGAWTVAGTKANYGVSGGVGSIAMPTPGIGPSVNLAGVSSSSSGVQVSVSPQQVPTGSGSFVSVFGRQVAGVGTYRAVVNLRSNGAVSLTIVRVDGAGQATVVPAAMVSGLTYAAGDKLNIRMQATGTSPTVLRAKVWKDGQAEPGWQLSGSDGAGAMQAAGSIGFMSYLAANATAGTTNRFDDLRVFDTTGVAQAAVVQQLAARQASPHPSDDDPPVNQQVSP